MTQELVKNLPEQARRTIYSAYAVLGLALGATQVGFSAADAGQPVWLTVALAVFAFVGTALGFTAAQNTGAKRVNGNVTSAALDNPHNTTP